MLVRTFFDMNVNKPVTEDVASISAATFLQLFDINLDFTATDDVLFLSIILL